MFESYLVGLLEKTTGYGLVGGGVSLGVDFEASKAHTIPSLRLLDQM